MRHFEALLAASLPWLVLTACGGVTNTGNGSGASSESGGGQGGGSAETGGAGGGDSPGGTGGFTGDGGRAPWAGGAPGGGSPGVAGGCTAGGPWAPPSLNGSGGNMPWQQPMCPLDAEGFATTTLDELCSFYRCPARASDLLEGLTCDDPATDDSGIVVTFGCGVDTVRFSGSGLLYEASFASEGSGPQHLRVGQSMPFGSCLAAQYQAGSARPDVTTETRTSCRQSAAPSGAYAGCREPGQPGCSACCESWGCEVGCNIATSSSGPGRYDFFYGDAVACPCECTPCAECTTELEHQLRTMPEKPECSCPAIQGAGGAGGDPCGWSSSGGNGPVPECLSHCSFRESLAKTCPGIVH